MTEFLTVPGGRLAYDVAGTGPLVVCAPGMGDVRAAYRFTTPLLTAAGYRVATVDLRGHGESSTGWPSYSHTAIGSDLLALVRHLGGGPAVLVGQSYSPDAAVAAAAEAPEEVAGVVLIAPWAHRPRPGPVMAWIQAAVLRRPRLLSWYWPRFYTSLYPGGKPADFAAYRATLRAGLRDPGRAAALAAMADPASLDAGAHRAANRRPALIVMGDQDPDFADPAAEARAMREALGGPADIVMIEGAGHYPQAQHPAPTARAIIEFLGDHLGGRPGTRHRAGAADA